ncbi:ribosomal large subunit pseudouridine synthase C [Candidatus Mycoplasma haematohominis]|uniref:RNA pseudouridylate synthase n=1 Tax=Candidatus Mycoplasma haematohominis TaxID=1494318 RepID=A0A478FSE0_9MOLU|nr:ribosomal large subunit pseudouridine synthase C [Candidatus Mycoplasma haemohominis]
MHKTKFEEENNLVDEISKDRRESYFLAHRIDKYTSGIVLLIKNKDNLKSIQQLFSENKVEKCYLAIVSKELPAKKVKISLSLGRSKTNKLMFSNRNAKNYKHAITEVQEIDSKFVFVKPITGRTHQIRSHLHDIGCTILNDPVYLKDKSQVFNSEFGQFLHAYRLSFRCPFSGSFIEAKAPLPEEFVALLKEMNVDYSSYE